MTGDEPVAWDNPATVAYQKRRRRTTVTRAAICFAVVFVIAQLSKVLPVLAGLLVVVNVGFFLATLGFLVAYARLPIREHTLRTSEWKQVKVVGHPLSFFGLPLGTMLEVDLGIEGTVRRIAAFGPGAELLDASRNRQSALKAGSGRGFLLSRPGGAPVVLARRIGPAWVQNFLWVMASEKGEPS